MLAGEAEFYKTEITMNIPEINPISNLSFSYSKNKSFKKDGYGKNFKDCQGWDRLKSAITQVVWSPNVFHDGVRLEENFAFSDFMALDFDESQSISEIKSAFADAVYIISTTKSHQIAKKKKGPCDRFRLLVPWERRILDLETYRASIAPYIANFGADTVCRDGARFYWPSVSIVAYQDPDLDLELATIGVPVPRNTATLLRFHPVTGDALLPRHVQLFLMAGIPFGGGRNISVFTSAKTLIELGLNYDQICHYIFRSPFDRTKFHDREIDTAINSAFKHLAKGKK